VGADVTLPTPHSVLVASSGLYCMRVPCFSGTSQTMHVMKIYICCVGQGLGMVPHHLRLRSLYLMQECFLRAWVAWQCCCCCLGCIAALWGAEMAAQMHACALSQL
jgi:hypothetical protein